MNMPTTDGKPADSKARTSEELEKKCNVNRKGKITGGPTDLGNAQPEKKNYINEKPVVAQHLLLLHTEWLKKVEPSKKIGSSAESVGR